MAARIAVMNIAASSSKTEELPPPPLLEPGADTTVLKELVLLLGFASPRPVMVAVDGYEAADAAVAKLDFSKVIYYWDFG